MDTARVDSLSRIAAKAQSRRGALVRAGVALLGLAAAPGLAQAKKGKGKRKCKNKNTNDHQPERVPTCEEHCFPDFPLCYTRTDGPPLCANGAFENGETPCASDQDCLSDQSKPYCLVSATSRDSGATNRFTTCELYGAGCCIYAGIFPMMRCASTGGIARPSARGPLASSGGGAAVDGFPPAD